MARPRRVSRPIALAYAWCAERIARWRDEEPAFVPDMVRVLSGDRVLSIAAAGALLGCAPAYPKIPEGSGAAYAEVFAGEVEPSVPAGRTARALACPWDVGMGGCFVLSLGCQKHPGFLMGSTTEADNSCTLENVVAMYEVAMEGV